MSPKSPKLSILAILAASAALTAQNVALNIRSDFISNIPIEVSVKDVYNHKNGRTNFRRIYKKNTYYTLTAPLTYHDGFKLARFHHWEYKDAPNGNMVKQPVGRNRLSKSIGSSEDWTVAHYIYETQISVRSIGGATKVPIEINKPDAWGAQNGTTQFFRKFAFGTKDVRFTAPLYHNGLKFYRWHVGPDRKSIGVRTVKLDIGINFQTVTAQYGRYTKGEHTEMARGCIGSNGKRLTQTPRFNPDIGLTIRYQLFDAPKLSAASLAVGASMVNFRLPGTPCFVRVDPVVIAPVTTNANGFALLNVRLPSSTNLIGQFGYTQFFAVDIGANALNLTTSDTWRTKVGGWKL